MPLTQIDPVAALIVIDLQQGLAGVSSVKPMPKLVERSAALADAFRAKGQPVVWVNVNAAAPGRVERKRVRSAALPEGWAELIPELGAQPDDLRITKHRPGAFLGTTLDAALRQRGVTQVFLTGVSTSMGVESTARSAFDLGYHVVFVTDAVSDLAADTQRFYEESIMPRLGERATTAEVLERLEAQVQG